MIDPAFITPLTEIQRLSPVNVKSDVSGSTDTSAVEKHQSFAETLRQKTENLKKQQQDIAQINKDVTFEDQKISGLMLEIAKSSAAVDTTVQITSGVISAYSEIMQMQV